VSVKISFISPCFNEEEWLPRLLLSLNACNADFDSFEFVVVDNASTDRTVEVLWDLLPVLKYQVRIVHEFRKGVSYARNAGASAASGETFVFVDADNLLTQGFVDQVCSMSRESDFCGATVRTLAEPGSLRGSLVFVLLEAIKMISPKPFGKSVACREAFFSVGGFDGDIKLGENVVFTTKVKCFARENGRWFAHINAPIFCSLRRFEKIGYWKILVPWFIAYVGARNLPYETVGEL
jgi:glycosyltransferase involved in cell wall biosynthesis